MGKVLPGGRILLPLGIVQGRSATSGYQVNQAVGVVVRPTMEGLVERPAPGYQLLLSRQLAIGPLFWNETERKRTLLILDVAAEDDVHFFRLEDVGQNPHVLLVGVFLRGLETRLGESTESPGRAPGGGEVALDPSWQVPVGPVNVRIGIENQPVGVAVVEGEIPHARIRRARGLLERSAIALRPLENRDMSDSLRGRRAVERLRTVKKVGQSVGIFAQIATPDIVVSWRRQEEGRTQKRSSVGRRCLLRIVNRPELLTILGILPRS